MNKRMSVERVFGFRHVIEVYTPAPERVYGYYVLRLPALQHLGGTLRLPSVRP